MAPLAIELHRAGATRVEPRVPGCEKEALRTLAAEGRRSPGATANEPEGARHAAARRVGEPAEARTLFAPAREGKGAAMPGAARWVAPIAPCEWTALRRGRARCEDTHPPR